MGGIMDVVHVGLLFCFVHCIEEKFILEKPETSSGVCIFGEFGV
jgi:hypothetical protein